MSSSRIQDEFVKVKYGLLEPIELKENDVLYGYYVPPSALMDLILRSDPILQHAVLNEPNKYVLYEGIMSHLHLFVFTTYQVARKVLYRRWASQLSSDAKMMGFSIQTLELLSQ